MIPSTLVPAILVAGVLAGVLLAAAGLLGRLGRARLAQVLAALAVGVGYVAGAIVLMGKPDVGGPDVQKWVVLLAPAAVVVGALEGTLRPVWARLLGHLVFVAGASLLLFRPWLFVSWSTGEALSTCGGLAFVSLGALGTLSVGGEHLAPRWAALTAFAFAAGASFQMLIAGSVVLGLTGGCVAATAGAAVVVSLLGLGLEKGRAVAGTVGALTTVLWARSYTSNEFKNPGSQAAFVAGVVLLALAPLAALLGERLTKGSVKPAKATVLRLALLAAPVVLALGLALATSPRFEPTGGSSEEGY